MNVKLIRAMQRCCSSKQGETLSQPTLMNGELCATDRVVAVRYFEPGWSKDKMPGCPWQLYEHETKGLKGTERVRVDAKGFHAKGMASHGYPASKYPGLCKLWPDLMRNPKGWHLDYAPRHVRRVLAVFEEAGVNVTMTDLGHALHIEGGNGKAYVTALVMGCRR